MANQTHEDILDQLADKIEAEALGNWDAAITIAREFKSGLGTECCIDCKTPLTDMVDQVITEIADFRELGTPEEFAATMRTVAKRLRTRRDDRRRFEQMVQQLISLIPDPELQNELRQMSPQDALETISTAVILENLPGSDKIQ